MFNALFSGWSSVERAIFYWYQKDNFDAMPSKYSLTWDVCR
jgi:hypothetical protein